MTQSGQALGNITGTVSPDRQKQTKRELRWLLLDAAGELLPEERVAWCCKRRIYGSEEQRVGLGKAGDRSGFSNLAQCGSIWLCPRCAAKISETRRAELAKAVKGWSGSVALITVTLQHDRTDQLKDLLEAVKSAWRSVKMGKRWLSVKARWQLAGSVTSTECTWGNSAGWHPHIHTLVFSNLQQNEFNSAELEAVLSDRFRAELEKRGQWASAEHGLTVTPAATSNDPAIGRYLSKLGLEMTRADLKSGRSGNFTPFQLLAEYQAGAKWAGPLFQEFAKAFSGRRQLVWSTVTGDDGKRHSFRDQVIQEPELTDEEIVVEPDPEFVVFVWLTWPQYQEVCRQRARGPLLEVARSGDAVKVWEYLVGIGIHPEPANFAGIQLVDNVWRY